MTGAAGVLPRLFYLRENHAVKAKVKAGTYRSGTSDLHWQPRLHDISERIARGNDEGSFCCEMILSCVDEDERTPDLLSLSVPVSSFAQARISPDSPP